MTKTSYDVGYRKPPKARQFQKGKSGNPGGRPKGKKNFKTLQQIIADELLEEVPITVNGKPCKLTRIQALIRVQFAAAMKENTGAARHLMTLADQHLPTHQTIDELMNGRPVFSWTEEDEARCSKSRLLDGVTYNEEDGS
jgi:hypothetical protein